MTRTTSGNADLIARWDAAILPTYPAPPLALVRGQGARVWDADGREYVDLFAGIAVNALGHAHPAVVEAVARQVATLGHVSNLAASEPAIRLAERLGELVGDPTTRVFFCNSGAEANETALKIARRHGREADPGGGRLTVVAADEAFHGRTFGALAVTGQPAKRDPFAPLPGPVSFVRYGDPAALDRAVGPHVAAVVLEPVLGEAGVVPSPPGYLAHVRAACDRAGALLVLDEVQGGIGRAGDWFAHRRVEPRLWPDVITLAKGLGGGLPIGACLARGPAATLLRPGDHGSTFGGNPVCCAAALAVLDTIAADGLLDRARLLGDRLAAGLVGLGHPLVRAVRGLGLWWGIELAEPVAGRVADGLRDGGLLVGTAGPSVLRLAPPLVVAEDDLAAFVAALPGVLDRPLDRLDRHGRPPDRPAPVLR